MIWQFEDVGHISILQLWVCRGTDSLPESLQCAKVFLVLPPAWLTGDVSLTFRSQTSTWTNGLEVIPAQARVWIHNWLGLWVMAQYATKQRLCISKQWPMLRRKKFLVLCLKNRVPTMNQKACELRAGLISLDNQPLMKQSFNGPKFEAHRMACAFGPSLAAGSPRPWMGDAIDFTCHLMISCILYISLYFVHHMVLFLF